MDTTDLLQGLFRWIHVVAGILWIGHLYFFNFVNGPFEGTLDAAMKPAVVPQLRGRGLFWFRWGALWTWVTGLLLLLLVFYHGKLALEPPADHFGLGGWLMIVVTIIVGFPVYEALVGSGIAANGRTLAAVSLVAIFVFAELCIHLGGFSYRGYVIHTGALFGTIMAANVWMRIWPAQREIMAAIGAGRAPDAALVTRAGTRSRHNTYMSVPLVWTMLETHTTQWSGSPLWLVIIIGVAWVAVEQLYAKAASFKPV